MNSISRMERQWDYILDSIMERDDYSPFSFGTNIMLLIEDKQLQIYSKRDLYKKLNQHGKTIQFSVTYKVNYEKLVHHVEEKVAYLLSTEEEQ